MNQRVYTFANSVTDFCPVLMPNNNRKAVTDYQAGRITKDVTERTERQMMHKTESLSAR